MRSLRADGKKPEAFEMSNINYAYYGKKYTYAYMARNFDRKEQNAITKVSSVFISYTNRTKMPKNKSD